MDNKFVKYNWPVKGEEVPFTEEENAQGNRTWAFDCGCVATSGAGAYGSTGDAWVMDHCPEHWENIY